MRSVRLFGKSIPLLAIVALVMTTGMASAALLSYYGRITATVDVRQSVLVDGGNYLQSNTYGGGATVAGNTIVDGPHTLLNQADVSVNVTLETTQIGDGTPDNNVVGITTTYYTPIKYYKEETFGIDSFGDLLVTVESSDDWVTWTFDFPVEGWTGNGQISAFVAISTDGTTPAFIIHNNDGMDDAHEWGAWLYSEYDEGWHVGDTNTPVSDIEWVEASGERYAQGTDGILQIRIKKCELGETFRYTASSWVGSGWYGSIPSTHMTIGAADWVDVPNYIEANLAIEISTFALQSGETLNFYIVNEFSAALIPETYTITTTVVPA